MYIISIDAGGTMTDAIVSGNGGILTLKVDSTPHDLTVSLMECLTEAGGQLGYEQLADFLEDVEHIRWSSTVASNVLGEQRGARIGLVVAAGSEETLYGDATSPVVGRIVASENIIGVTPDLEDAELLDAVRSMLRRGVRRICIALPGSFPDNGEERRLKAVINDQYPDHFVGSVPVVLGSEIAQTPDDLTRAHCAVINAYVHPSLAASLFKAEDRLKDEAAWTGPLLIGHTNGGLARVGKTRAIDTIESGPVFGLFGAASFASHYGLDRVLCLDVGGTTSKTSLVKDERPLFHTKGDLFGIPVRSRMALLRSCSVGGGSIATVEAGSGSPAVGPESMGSSPGPASYGLGGTQATVTDAFVTLGYMDPSSFQGGRRQLDPVLAARAINDRVSNPLGISVDDGAQAIRQAATKAVARLVEETAQVAGENVDGMTLFATGGNGPLFAPFVADQVGIRRVVVFFALGPVFSAFGCNTSDLMHNYSRGVDISLMSPTTDQLIADHLKEMRGRAVMDLEGEGYEGDNVSFVAEFEVQGAASGSTWLSFDVTDGNVSALASLIADEGDGAAAVRVVALKASHAIESYVPDEKSVGCASGDNGTRRTRPIKLAEGEVEAQVFDWSDLVPGQSIAAPAIVAGGDVTCIVPTGWTLHIDKYGNGQLSR